MTPFWPDGYAYDRDTFPETILTKLLGVSILKFERKSPFLSIPQVASGGESVMEKRIPMMRYPLLNIDGVCMQKDTLECPFDKILIINMREQFIRFSTN